MREDLLGYLLGALEPDEVERIERELQSNPELQEELDRIALSLQPLEEEPEDFEPPRDLISNTLSFIDDHKTQPVGMSSAHESERTDDNRMRIPDAIVAVISLIAVGGLLFPAILEGRFEARRAQCQDNLREVGMSLTEYAFLSPDNRFPEIPLEGPLAFAGMYSVELNERGEIDSSDVWCPARNLPESLDIPAKSQLERAQGAQLVELQGFAGGHMAYTLGVIENNIHYRAPKYQARSAFPIIGDAPIQTISGESQVPHQGRGFNLFFEDGSVRFVSPVSMTGLAVDNPYRNQENRIEAGINENDASLGESSRAPFVQVPENIIQ